MKIKNLPITELKPYENNPRINDAAVPAVAESIRQFGFKQPIVIDKNNVIVCGHTRYKAAIKLGLKTVPCVIADDLTDDQIKAYRLADNKVGELASWDMELLDIELEGISDIDMGDFGFELESDCVPDEGEEDEYDIDEGLIQEPRVRSGEIWQLGRHRLLCGDSTNPEDIAALMDGEEADLLITDPPYNVNYQGGTKEKLKIENDAMDNAAFLEFLQKAFESVYDVIKPGAPFYVYYASRQHINFETALNNAQLKVRQQLIWVKNALIIGRQDYQWRHEPLLYGWKEGAAHYFIDDRTQTTVIEDEQKEFKKMRKDELVRLLEEIFSDKTSSTIIHEDKPVRNAEHPTMKPIKLLARHVKNSSKIDDLVLDIFGGSGSTLIACEQLRRRCNIMEYDERYATVIVDRWEKLTGHTATKIK